MQVGRYQLQEEIARGGMGVVYRALDPSSGEQVALKRLLDPDPDPRFRQEAQALARLDHPGIVTFRELFTDAAGRDALVMEWVDGVSLKEALTREGPFPEERARDVIAQLCDAVAHAHARGVLHRDLKPHNVLLTRDGRVKLTDFGLGKLFDQPRLVGASLTRSGEIMGTPAYMPPEQALGDKAAIGPRADVYGLGATLYALLTGRPPFSGATTINVLRAVLERPPEPPSTHRLDLHPELDAVVLRCLAKDPAERFASVEELAAALRPVPPPARAGFPVGPVWLGAAAIAVGLAAALVARPAASAPPPAPSSPGADAPPSPPSTAAAWLERAQTAANVEDWQGVEQACTEAIALEPEQPLAYAQRAIARVNRGDLPRAFEDATRAMRRDPQEAQHPHLRAQICMQQEDIEAALDDYGLAIDLAPERVDLRHERARLLIMLGRLELAEADLTRAFELTPEHAQQELRATQASLRLRQGLLLEALFEIERAVSLAPDDARCLTQRGVIRTKLGRLAEAEDDYTRAIEVEPSYGVAWAARADLRLLQQRHAAAVADLDEALRLSPNDALLLRTRADAHFRLGDMHGAVEDGERALAIDPSIPGIERLVAEARRALSNTDPVQEAVLRGLTEAQSRRSQRAMEAFDEAIRLGPDRPDGYMHRGDLRWLLKDADGALADLDRAVERSASLPPALRARLHSRRRTLRRARGDLEGAQADRETAIAEFERALQLDPQPSLADQLRAELEALRGR